MSHVTQFPLEVADVTLWDLTALCLWSKWKDARDDQQGSGGGHFHKDRRGKSVRIIIEIDKKNM